MTKPDPRFDPQHPQHIHRPGCDHTDPDQEAANARRKAWEKAHAKGQPA